MTNHAALLVAMAEKCRDVVLQSTDREVDQPPSLEPKHLIWMCEQIAQHAAEWPETRSHRWIGFLQGAMIANRMLDLEGAKRMFDAAKNAYGDPDVDLVDHLDPENDFELDLGGQG